jgi:hypothetical protein
MYGCYERDAIAEEIKIGIEKLKFIRLCFLGLIKKCACCLTGMKKKRIVI